MEVVRPSLFPHCPDCPSVAPSIASAIDQLSASQEEIDRTNVICSAITGRGRVKQMAVTLYVAGGEGHIPLPSRSFTVACPALIERVESQAGRTDFSDQV